MNKQQPLENASKSPTTKKQKNSILANKSLKQIKRKKGNTQNHKRKEWDNKF